MTMGRAMSATPKTPRPIVDIADDGKATIARMKVDAERLRQLGAEAEATVGVAVARAEDMLGRLFEAGARAVCERLDQLDKAIKK